LHVLLFSAITASMPQVGDANALLQQQQVELRKLYNLYREQYDFRQVCAHKAHVAT
jgi:hypothetical protein